MLFSGDLDKKYGTCGTQPLEGAVSGLGTEVEQTVYVRQPKLIANRVGTHLIRSARTQPVTSRVIKWVFYWPIARTKLVGSWQSLI